MAKEMHDSMLKDLETPPVTFLVANKTDVTASQRQVTSDQGREQAVTMGVGYLECSAMTGTGIPDLLQYMAEELVRQVESVGTSLPREKIKPNGSSPFSIGRDYPPPKSSESAGGGCNC